MIPEPPVEHCMVDFHFIRPKQKSIKSERFADENFVIFAARIGSDRQPAHVGLIDAHPDYRNHYPKKKHKPPVHPGKNPESVGGKEGHANHI